MGVACVPDGDGLRLVVEEVRSSVPGCGAAVVSVVRGDDPVTVVGTSLLGCQLEQAQWTAQRGPAVDAIRQLQVFNVSCLSTARSWPEFTRVALGRGVRSTLAVPVTARGRALGVLNLYSSERDAFAGRESVAVRYASQAAALLAGVEWTPAVSGPSPAGPPAGGPDVVPAIS